MSLFESHAKDVSWREFEVSCAEYLNKRFRGYASFELMGDRDSTATDIRVLVRGDCKFSIEAKKYGSQCGQFVVLEDQARRRFYFSQRNKTKETPETKKIIEYMNRNYERYSNAGTAGVSLDGMPGSPKIFYNWVAGKYANSGVKLMITGLANEGRFQVFPLKRIADYFAISATYRSKPSGSSSLPAKEHQRVRNYLADRLDKYEARYHSRDGKLLVITVREIKPVFFSIQETRYKFSDEIKTVSGDMRALMCAPGEYIYEIRRLSNTKNANVIFTLDIRKNPPPGISDGEFLSYL